MPAKPPATLLRLQEKEQALVAQYKSLGSRALVAALQTRRRPDTGKTSLPVRKQG